MAILDAMWNDSTWNHSSTGIHRCHSVERETHIGNYLFGLSWGCWNGSFGEHLRLVKIDVQKPFCLSLDIWAIVYARRRLGSAASSDNLSEEFKKDYTLKSGFKTLKFKSKSMMRNASEASFRRLSLKRRRRMKRNSMKETAWLYSYGQKARAEFAI